MNPLNEWCIVSTEYGITKQVIVWRVLAILFNAKRAEILMGPSLSTISGLVLVAPVQLMA